MPFEQLRGLVISLIDPEPAEAIELDEEAVAEFDTRPTNCLPGPRTSTLDQLIAALPRHGFARGSTVEPAPEPDPPAGGDPRARRPRPRDHGRAGSGRGSQRR